MVRISRIIELEVPDDLEGICFNESLHAGRSVKVKASNKMCSVGIIRRGRSWGDYGGSCCGDCPYFISKVALGRHEHELLEEISEKLSVPVDDLIKDL